MDGISAAWLYPIIVIAGALQAWGPPMNNALRKALMNPWLASAVSFLPIVAVLGIVFLTDAKVAGVHSAATAAAPPDGRRTSQHSGTSNSTSHPEK